MTWSVIVLRDGEPVTDEVPCDDWAVASHLAPFFVGWMGGRVSVASAVVNQRVADRHEPSLFDEDQAA